jgi:hypothetical protein
MTPSFTACHPARRVGDTNVNSGTCWAWAIDDTPISGDQS